MLLLLHSAFMLSVVKMLLKEWVGGCALNSHGNYIVDHGKSWKNHGIVVLNLCGNPVIENGMADMVIRLPYRKIAKRNMIHQKNIILTLMF